LLFKAIEHSLVHDGAVSDADLFGGFLARQGWDNSVFKAFLVVSHADVELLFNGGSVDGFCFSFLLSGDTFFLLLLSCGDAVFFGFLGSSDACRLHFSFSDDSIFFILLCLGGCPNDFHSLSLLVDRGNPPLQLPITAPFLCIMGSLPLILFILTVVKVYFGLDSGIQFLSFGIVAC